MVDITQLEKVLTESDVQSAEDKVNAKLHLQETDWYIVRFVEIGVPVPAEVTASRAEARATLAK